IEQLLKLKQSLIEENQKKEKINSFNKYSTVLKFKDNIEPLEFSFWSTFRNKTIFKRIFS
ncbi:hypothetical protein DICPUDRAFT_13646, partial [Dictyostelium purpureum]